jgi:hypothetical protein
MKAIPLSRVCNRHIRVFFWLIERWVIRSGTCFIGKADCLLRYSLQRAGALENCPTTWLPKITIKLFLVMVYWYCSTVHSQDVTDMNNVGQRLRGIVCKKLAGDVGDCPFCSFFCCLLIKGMIYKLDLACALVFDVGRRGIDYDCVNIVGVGLASTDLAKRSVNVLLLVFRVLCKLRFRLKLDHRAIF